MRRNLQLVFLLICCLSAIELSGAERYWVNGSGRWSDASHWSDSSGGKGGAGVPSLMDNVYFDNNSFLNESNPSLIIQIAFCKNFNWFVNNVTPAIKGDEKASLTVGGSFVLTRFSIIEYSGAITFQSDDKNRVVCKPELYSDLKFKGNGTWNVGHLFTKGSILEGKEKLQFTAGAVRTGDPGIVMEPSLYGKSTGFSYEPMDISLVITGVTPTHASGPGLTDGTLTVSVLNQTPPVTLKIYKDGDPIALATQVDNYVFTGLGAGNYAVEVIDSDFGYDYWPTVTIVQHDVRISSYSIVATPTCVGSSDGKMRVNLTASNNNFPPYTYQYSNNGGASWVSAASGAFSYIFTGLSAGSYLLRVSDVSGYTSTYAFNPASVPDPAPVNLTINNPAAVCSPNTVDITAAAVTAGSQAGLTLTYWTDAGATIAYGTPATATAGTYYIKGTTAAGCFSIKPVTVTVNPLPAAITGTTSVCIGSTTTLSDATPGGTWSSGSPAVATINASGVVTGVSVGTSVISYTLPTGCFVTTTVTVNTLPAAIGGTLNVCVGSTTTLTDASPGGTWSSATPAVATINAATGVVTGVSAGTSLITYTLPTGCFVTAIVTVNPLPAAITGTLNVCIGLTTALADATAGGTWSSATPAVATINASGVVTGVSAGTSVISYTLPTGCFVTATVTVNALPNPITGTLNVCVSSTTTLSNATPGGTWSSGTPAVATISVGGVVTGVSAGTSVISYTLPTGCLQTATVTVNPLPAAIGGTFNVCVGSTRTLTDATAGGTWTSGTPAVATISAGGIVTGVSAGTSVITYTLPTGCFVTANMTVNPVPAAITGTLNVCVGSTTTLSDATVGGTWSSGTPAVATISAGGVVTGVSAGTSVISYTLPTGCLVTATVTVNALPAAITGTTNVCVGSTTTLSDATAGGTWSSGTPAVATISAGGVVTGVSAGTSVITYTLGTGCFVTTTVTVNPNPAAITGTTNVCVGSTTTLSDATVGGTWSSGTPAVATISAGGVVTGVSAGTSVISYTLPTGCFVTTTVTVNPVPAAITGTTNVCVGSTTTLSDATAGGTWSSDTPAVATINAGGVVTGVSAGTSVITYTLGTGCFVTTTVTVNPVPAAITGTTNVCVGLTTTLSDATVGGTWSSGTPAVATISAGGVVTGVSAGTSVISYTLPTGCFVTATVTVNPVPAVITGTTNVCVGSTTTLSDATAGGTWSSGTPAVATVNAATGVVTGVSAGTSVISYTLATGCLRTATVTVNPLPAAIGGTLNVCIGQTTTLTDATAGGTWSSGTPAVATVNAATGVVTGVSAGTSVITYTLPTGCFVTATVTVLALPAAIGGTLNVCVGSTTTLTDATAGGTWSSGTPAVATINAATGLVTGVSAGTSVITYTLGSGCFVTATVTVNPNPAAITGTTTVCVGLTTTLADATAGGTWSSGTPAIATVNVATGVVTGVSAGTSVITYALPTGCFVTTNVTVNPLPAAITGTTNVCVGSTTTLSDATAGGTWSSATPAVATINAATGVVTGVSAGTSVISYTLGTGCLITTTVTVNPLPGAITGTTNVCVGLTTSLKSVTLGGTWSSGTPAVATIDAATGIVTGMSAGTSVITYTLPTGCFVTTTVTVNPLPAAITGTTNVCVGLTTTLADVTPGGTWSSATPAVATISAGGVVTGVSAGTSVISYTLGTGCAQTATVTVNPLPAAIGGTLNVCVNSTTTLTNATAGGTWSSGTPAVATINAATGVVTGVSGGSSIITYTLGTGCLITATVTVNPLPAAIGGTLSACIGSTTTLTDATAGGTWSSGTPAVATVNAATGVVTGVSAGTSVITYTLPTGCFVTATVTINSLPAAIGGTLSACVGLTSTLTDATAGGTWSSATPAVATINAASGLVTAVSAGTSVITYTIGTGCFQTATFTVNANPSFTSVTPHSPTCFGTNDGSIDFIYTSGNGPFTTEYSNGGPWIASGSPITGLTAGNYNVRVTDKNSCTDTKATTIIDAVALNATVTPTNITTCFGATTGKIDITAPSGGSGQYQYTRDGGTTWTAAGPGGYSYTNLAAGTYNVQMRDAANPTCLKILNSNLVINQPSQLTFTVATQHISCYGVNNGSIVVHALGGTQPYTFSRGALPFQSDSNYTGLNSGTYLIRVRDANACASNPAFMNVTINPALEIRFDVESGSGVLNKCFGDANGTIDIQLRNPGGTPPFQYSIDNELTYTPPSALYTHSFTNLPGGSYQIYVKDANGCRKKGSGITIDQPFSINLAVVPTPVTPCFGDANGEIIASASGGTGSLTYTIDGGTTFDPTGWFTGLRGGNYTAMVVDANGCTKTANTTITEPPAIVITSLGLVQPTCSATPNGSINANAMGGDGTWTFSLDGGAPQGNGIYPAVGVGSHTLRVTDGSGCHKDSTFNMTAPPPISLSSVKKTDITCNGLTNGTVTAVAAGGTPTPSYTYTLNPGGFTNTTGIFNALAANNYTVSVTDALACPPATQAIAVVEPTILKADSVVYSDSICNGATNGYIRVYASGATAPYEYSNDNGTTWGATSNYTNLGTGAFPVKIRDKNLCSITYGTVNIYNYPAINITSVNSTPVANCFGDATGQIVVNTTGGSGALQYSVDSGTTYQASNTFNGLTAKYYCILVKDSKSCTTKSNKTITQPSKITIAITPTHVTTGNNGKIDATASGGAGAKTLTIDNWVTSQNDPASFTNLAVGKYYVKAKDTKNCEVTDSVTLLDWSSLITNVTLQQPKCVGDFGSITVTTPNGTNPVTYSINNGGAPITNATGIFNNVPSGTWYISTTDSKPSTKKDTVVLSTPTPISVTVTKTDVNMPTLGTIQVIVSGGAGNKIVEVVELALKDTTVKNPDTINFVNIVAGTYNIKVTDTNNCIVIQPVTINSNTAFNVTVVKKDVQCNGANNGTIDLTVVGGTTPYTYTVTHETFGLQTESSSFKYTNLRTGRYFIYVKDAGTNEFYDTVTVTQPTRISYTIAVSNAITAPNGSITFSAVSGGLGPKEFSIDSGKTFVANPDFQNLDSGWYHIAVRDSLGCTIYHPDSTYIEYVAGLLNPVVVDSAGVTCPGGTDGHIYFTVIDPMAVAPIMYSIDGGKTYSPFENFTGLSADTFYLDIKDVRNYRYFDTIVLSSPTPMWFDSLSITYDTAKCNHFSKDGKITGIKISGGTKPYTYYWQNAANDTISKTDSLVNASAGYYTFNVVDSNKCKMSTWFTLPSGQSVAAYTPDTVRACYGETYHLIGYGGAVRMWTWIDNDDTVTTEHRYDTLDYYTGPIFKTKSSYQLIVFSADMQCKDYDTVTVLQYPRYLFGISASDSAVSEGSTVTLSMDSYTDKYQTFTWSPCINPANGVMDCDTTVPSFEFKPNVSTTYSLEAVTKFAYGSCRESASKKIAVLSKIVPYTAFTPNEDGVNDFWVIKNAYGYKNMTISVFNRWGELVWQQKGCNQQYDGTYDCSAWDGKRHPGGFPVPIGVYYFVIDPGEGSESITGTVTIAR